jgi:hypothetical protein
MEHRGRVRLAAVASANCTACHEAIAANATGATVRNVSAFRPGKHPEFSPAKAPDQRPLRLNHAIHMPATPNTVRGLKLPMKCVDCHVVDHDSPTGTLLPVTFEQNCKSCHARELEFDVDHVLGDQPVPAPHTKDVKVIRQVIWDTYAAALNANPALARRPVGSDLAAQAGSETWMRRVVDDAVKYLFGRKCGYCHQMKSFAEVSRVGSMAGRYAADGGTKRVAWLQRGEFSHRAHRALDCERCHTEARASTKTEDVLIPRMKACVECHGTSGTSLDECVRCHLYHNRGLEKDRLPGSLLSPGGAPQ